MTTRQGEIYFSVVEDEGEGAGFIGLEVKDTFFLSRSSEDQLLFRINNLISRVNIIHAQKSMQNTVKSISASSLELTK